MTQIDPLLLAIAGAGLPGAAPPARGGWDDHIEAVIANNLAGLFSASAAAGMIDIDAQMAGRLQRQLDSEAVRAVQLEGELIRLAPGLDHLGALVLRGAVLAHAAYADPLLRPFTDIDLLVPEERVADAISILATYGYQRARPEPAPGYDARVGKAVVLQHAGGVVIDLHRTFAPGNAGEVIDVQAVVSSRRSIAVGAHTIPAPSWEAHLVECALHAVVGDGLTRPLSLRDIAEVAHHPALDPNVAAALAVRWQVAELVGLGLRATCDGLGVDLPDPLAGLARSADVAAPASEPARSRLDELRTGNLPRRATVARSLVAPSAEFLRWAHGDAPLPRLYGRRWRSLYQTAMDARLTDAPEPASPDPLSAETAGAPLPAPPPPPPADDSLATVSLGPGPPGGSLPEPVYRRTAGTLERAVPVSRQEAWSRARPPRQAASSNGHGRHPRASGGGSDGRAGDNGDGDDGDGDDGSGPPAGQQAADGDPTRGTAPAAPARSGIAFGVAAGALLATAALGAQLGTNRLGVVLVPAASLLVALAASRHITRLRPDEAWVGRWLVLAVLVKVGASYFRYHTIVNDYGGVADATLYDEWGQRLASAWRDGGSAPELVDLRQTNFVRWFTGVVYYLFGTDMVTGFFVFGLLAVLGSYLWYRATVDAVPRVDKRLYLGLVLFAPSVTFWPSSIGKESLMQLGIGAAALATAHLLRHRLAKAAILGFAGGWLLWVVRPHLLALVTVAAGCAYAGGRVRDSAGAMGSLLRRPVGLLGMAFLVAFTANQGAKFLGMEDLSLSSIEAELDETTEGTSQGGSEFDSGDNSLNPIHLPRGAVTVLLRPFPWETESSLQLLSSLESAVLAGLLVARLSSLRAALTGARSTPFLLFCWVFVILYSIAYSSFANLGLLVRQRSLVLPALYVLLAVRAPVTTKEPAPSTAVRPALPGGVRAPR
jgi:Uncharacterised nucleotidyltransferase